MQRFQDGFKREDFQEARNSNTVEGALAALEMVGTNLNQIDPLTLKRGQAGRMDRVCFIVVNTYVKEAYKLGPGPLNDSLTVAQNLHDFEYRIGFLHNTTPTHFLKWLRFVLENVTDALFLFYTGHGACVADRDGDEDDGKDEVMVFDTGYVVDDELANYLRRYCRAKRTVLLNDCCHSGTLWDLTPKPKLAPIPPGVMSISSALDSQTAKQTKLEARDQGIFTFYFWNYFTDDQEISPNELAVIINKNLAKYKQVVVLSTTSEEMLDEPILYPPEPKPKKRRQPGRGRRGGA
jgi:hypothetical protein